MQRTQSGVTLIEIIMAIVVLAIVAVVALPVLQDGGNTQIRKGISVNANQAIDKVKTAYAFAIADHGDYPQLSQIVDFVDADFASEKNDLGGIVFWGYKKRVVVKTYNDENCEKQTSGEKPGVSDIVRCVESGIDA